MLHNAAHGEDHDLVEPPTLPPPPESTDEARRIRAALLRWLCVTQDAHAYVSSRGIRVRCAVIDGHLGLEHCSIPKPLWIEASTIPDGICLAAAHLRELSLDGSRVCGPPGFSSAGNTSYLAIDGSQVRVAKSLSLAKGFVAVGEVRLLGARIEGQLNCRTARLENLGRTSLSAENISVDGDVFLDQGFTSFGEVRLVGALIRGNLSCRGARIENPRSDKGSSGYALGADRLFVGGSVQLDCGFTAIGQVRLLGASIAGQLACGGAVLENTEYCSLCADSISVGGDVFLNECSAPSKPTYRFVARGPIRLIRGKIGGQLALSGATISSDGNDTALLADSLYVDGAVLLDSGFTAQGNVDFTSSTLDDYFRVHGATINGNLLLTHAEIAERFSFQQSQTASIDLSHASVTVLDDDAQSWPTAGHVNLDGFKYDRIEHSPTIAWTLFRRTQRDLQGWMSRRWSRVPPPSRPPTSVNSLDWRIEWIRRQDRYVPQPYEQLARTLQAAGYESEARRVAVEKQVDRRQRGGLWRWPRVKSLFLGLTLEHGYSPLRPFIPAVAIVILWWWIFYRVGFAEGAFQPASGELLKGGDNPPFNAFVFSLDTFLPIVDFGQERAWRPKGDDFWGNVVLIAYWFEVALGWIISSILVLGLSRIVRQD